MPARSVIFDIIGKDSASPAFRRVAASADAAAASMARSEKALARISTAGTATAAVGRKLTTGLTIPLAAIGAVAVKQSMDFQKSMTLLQTAGGESQKNMGLVAAGIKKIAVQTGTSLGSLSQGMYTVEKAGIRGADGLTVLKAAAQGAKAENVDLGTATNALTSVMMSYHLGASKAVNVQNALVVGAGKAKTTMQEYAASLATVVPVAAAAGVKFDQVAGAIATLTQHGTSAAEATQELAFTIRNLQAPNQVAISAMGQLGISANDVSKNLGKRGLTGTIQYIESRLPKTGLVYLNTMKQMASGTAGLTAMQGKMSPKLAALSQGFLKGTVSAKDYRTEFKNMGAAGYAQGSQFLSLAARMKGYNDAIRNGSPQQKTMAAELKAIFGGAVGLNTALQLGGKNMGYFKGATQDVNKALSTGGKNISTWAKTQNTLAVKADQAKAKLQVLAVNIGDKLMPIALKAVGAFSKLVTWFSNLSPGVQGAIVKFGVFAAVAGPALAIVGKLLGTGARFASWGLAAARGMGNFTKGLSGVETSMAGMQTRSYGYGSRAGSSLGSGLAKGLSVGIRGLVGGGIGGAVGIGIGDLVSKATGGAVNKDGTLNKKSMVLSGLAKVLSGAATGGLLGGAPGAVVGAGVGAFSAIRDAFEAPGNAAKAAAAHGKAMLAAAVAETKQSISDALSGIGGDAGAFGQNFQSTLVGGFNKSGSLGIAAKAGLNPRDLIKAATGNMSWQSVDKLNASLAKAAATGKISSKEFLAVSNAIGTQTNAAQNAEREYILNEHAMGRGIIASGLLGVSYRKLRAATASSGTSLDFHTAAGIRNSEVLREDLGWINKNRTASLAHGVSIKKTTTALGGQISSLVTNATKLGFNRSQVLDLVSSYTHIPKSVLTNVLKHGMTPANIKAIEDSYNRIPKVVNTKVNALVFGAANVNNLLYNLHGLRSKTVYIKAITEHDTFNNTYSNSQPTSRAVTNSYAKPKKAAGGLLRGPGTGTSDSIAMWGSNGEFVVNAKQTAKHRGELEAINSGRGSTKPNVTVNQYFYEQSDPQASGNASLRRLQAALSR